MGLNKIKDALFPKDKEDYIDTEDEAYEVDEKTISKSNGNRMVLAEPRAYSESQQIADQLKKRNAVIVNLKKVTNEQSKRIIDFLSGTLYAIGGDLQKISNGTYLCTPKNVEVEGRISDEDSEKKSKAKIEDEIDF